MNKVFLTLCVFLAAISVTGCSLFQTDGTGEVPYNLTTADQKHYDTIGMEFRGYFEADEVLAEEVEATYVAALEAWLAAGSTWEVYDVVATPYLVYVTEDTELTDEDKTARRYNVEAWEINVEVRNGVREVTEEVE